MFGLALLFSICCYDQAGNKSWPFRCSQRTTLRGIEKRVTAESLMIELRSRDFKMGKMSSHPAKQSARVNAGRKLGPGPPRPLTLLAPRVCRSEDGPSETYDNSLLLTLVLGRWHKTAGVKTL